MAKQYVSLHDVHVELYADDPRLFELVHFEIGDFFPFSQGTPPESTCIATLQYVQDKEENEKSRQIYANLSFTEEILHNGSHDYDYRVGKRAKAGHLTVLDSSMTGTLFVINDEMHHITVYNTDLKSGAADIRRLIRDQTIIPALEAKGAIVIHGAAFALGQRGYLVTGEIGSGKTSFFMAALANGETFSYFSCERIVLMPENQGLRIYACPENISFMRGTLLTFPETRDFAADSAPDEYWLRAKKLRVPWRSLVARFTAQLSDQPVYLEKVLFPSFSQETSGITITEISADGVVQRLEANTVTRRDRNRPTWLPWFPKGDEQQVFELLQSVQAQCLEWSTTGDLVQFLQKEASGRLHEQQETSTPQTAQ